MTDIVRKGLTLKQDLQEAAAIAPLGRAMLYAYELWHETLAEPIRFVNDKADLLATLEADAPRNAGEEVEFIACPLDRAPPEESDTAASPSVSLGRPDVGGILKAAFDVARGSLATWTLIERLYASDNTSGPAMLPPLTYELTNGDVSGAAGKVTAAYDDDANIAIPAITFKRSEYPGLAR
jgi:uncharacterized protein DUF1833